MNRRWTRPCLGLLLTALAVTPPRAALAAPDGWPVLGLINGFACYMGATRGGEWIANTGPLDPRAERYQLYGLSGQVGTSAAGDVAAAESAFCPELIGIDLQGIPAGQSGVALAGPWPGMPRPVTVASHAPEVYRETVARAFGAADGEITQVLRADLDGDGTEEALIAAVQRRPASETAPLSGYQASAVIIRRIVSFAVAEQTIVLARRADGFFCAPLFKVAALADLNGDGTMEIVVQWVVPDSDAFGMDVFRLTPAEVARTPLSCGC
jgi:hypothetical protein